MSLIQYSLKGNHSARVMLWGVLIAVGGTLYAQSALPSGQAELQERKSSAEVKTMTPKIVDNAIVAGNKSLLLRSNGRMTLMVDNESVGNLRYYFGLTDKKTGKLDWFGIGDSKRFNAKQSSFRADGGKFCYTGVCRINGTEWEFYRQTVELLPDGLVKISGEWTPPPDENFKITNHFFSLSIPLAVYGGKTVMMNDRQITVPEKRIPGKNEHFLRSKGNDWQCRFFPDNPAKSFIFSSRASSPVVLNTWLSAQGNACFWFNGSDRHTEIYLDIRHGTEAETGPDVRAGVDFRTLENLAMPDDSSKNLLRNPSFEQALHGYEPLLVQLAPTSGMAPDAFMVDPAAGKFGTAALRLAAAPKGQPGRISLFGPVTVIEPGTYTLSFYARASRPGIRIVSPRPYQILNTGMPVWGHFGYVPVPMEWKRYEYTFDSPDAAVCCIQLSLPVGKDGYVWIDGIQLEKGSKATEFTTRATESRFETCERGNVLDTAMKLEAKLILTTRPGAAGRVTIAVKNFFSEEKFRQEFQFRADAGGIAEISLPFTEEKLGRGLFVLRAETELASGEKN
ncbi:MAG: hypothetical protein PHV59_11870, partial [Victivallales bacterium]|nr:hypothetical protein [Victivallales bacterium]